MILFVKIHARHPGSCMFILYRYMAIRYSVIHHSSGHIFLSLTRQAKKKVHTLLSYCPDKPSAAT